MIEKAPVKYCFEYREIKHSSILVITDSYYIDDYMESFTDKEDTHNFRCSVIPEGSKVAILSYQNNNKLAKAVLINSTL